MRFFSCVLLCLLPLAFSGQSLMPGISVDSSVQEDPQIALVIAPYKKKVQQLVGKKIATAHYVLSNRGKEKRLNALLAQFLFEEASEFAERNHYPPVDMSFMGFFGVRKSSLKGEITVGDIYELMPFENTLYLVALPGREVNNLLHRFVTEKLAHPVYGLRMRIAGDTIVSLHLHKDKVINPSKTYYIATPSYWAEGGDGMDFFKKGVGVNTRLKIRTIFLKRFALMENITKDDSPIYPVEWAIAKP